MFDSIHTHEHRGMSGNSIAESHSTVQTYPSLFIRSGVDGHFNPFQLLDAVNKVAVHIFLFF